MGEDAGTGPMSPNRTKAEGFSITGTNLKLRLGD